MKISQTLPLIVFFLLALILTYSTNLASKASFMPSMVGKNIQPFQIPDLMSDTAAFSSTDINDITIINLFASWCESCRWEHPLLLELSKNGYRIYGLDVADDRQKALDYLKAHGNPYQKVGFDPEQTVAISLGSAGLPETFVVDKNGLIYFHERGVLTQKIIDRQMLPIIEGIKKKP